MARKQQTELQKAADRVAKASQEVRDAEQHMANMRAAKDAAWVEYETMQRHFQEASDNHDTARRSLAREKTFAGTLINMSGNQALPSIGQQNGYAIHDPRENGLIR